MILGEVCSMNKQEENKLFKEMFFSSFILENCYNYERQQALGYAVAMWPAIKRFYKTKEAQAQALVRHMEIFNTTPHLVSFIMGVTAAIEKKASETKNFDYSIINNVKVGLMGPLAGIGDSFFWGTIRVIAIGIALSMAQQGNILAPIVFLVLFNVPHLIIRYFGTAWGYKFGVSMISNAGDMNIMQKISKAANIVGLAVVGAMTASMVDLKTAFSFTISEQAFEIQKYLDQIFPGILALGYTMLMFYFLQKKKSATFLLLFTIVFAFVGTFIKAF